MENLKVLGFDIGVASIGWAFVEGGELKDCGVRIFTKAESAKDGSSLALPRREARGVRRRLARRKGRLNALKRIICKEFGLNRSDYLANAGELPKAYATSKETKSPYQLRAEALQRKLSADEFARVILHIAKHRGYGNKHAKESSDEKDEKKKNEQKGIKSGIAKNEGYKDNYQTIGAYLYNEFYCKERIENKKRNNTQGDTQEFVNVRNRGKGYYERCLKQDWLKEELEIIFAKQREFGFKFSDKKHKIINANGKLQELDFANAVLEIAFLQRPLKSFADKVGKCTFYENEPRAPKDSLSAIEFVALTRIINTLANITKRSGEVYSADKVREILAIVLEKGEITYKNLRKVIALDDKLQFPNDSKLDYTKENTESATALVEFSKLKAFKKALGGSFEGFSRAELDAIATHIAFIKSKDELKATLSKIPSLNESQVENLSELSFDKFIDLSFKALEAILPLMRGDSGECKRYDEAWREAGLKEVAKKTQKGDSLPPLIEYEKNLANPVVARALAEYRKVLNALLKKYGKVHKIHLEFTRQAGVSSKERGEIIAEQNKRLKANEEARKLCEQYGLIPSGKNILKLKLWQEQGEHCVYSGGKITQSDLSDDSALQIDHIYPYSRSGGDDSFNNKVLVFTKENQEKSNQTPYEAFGKDIDKWNRILGLIQKLPKAKKNRITNKNFADKEAGFIARNIVDTSYIATLTASYTDAFIEFCPLVENEDTTLGRGEKGSKKHITVVNGSLTATMRHYWGLNTLLDSEDSEKKDRSNHLHHALDAIIIAYANDSIIKAFSDFKKTQEQNKARLIAKEIKSAEYNISRRFFAPSNFENNEAFRQAIKRKILGESRESRENNTAINSEAMSEKEGGTISGIFVSKPPRKRARGALHKEGFGYVDKNDNWKVKFYNPSSGKLVIKDYGGREGLEMALQSGKIHALIKRGKKKKDDLEFHKFALNENMPRLDIYRRGNKFYAVPIYIMDFAKGKPPNIAIGDIEMNESELCFSLFKDDLIAIRKKGMSEAVKCYYKTFDIDSCRIFVEKHDNYYVAMNENESKLFTEKGKAKKDENSKSDSERKIIGGRVSIQNLKIFEKWQVSPLGEVSKAEFREREPISLKSSQKKIKGQQMSFDEAFKSVIISNEAKLSLKQKHLHISQADNEANLYLKDLSFIILESPQITLTSALLSAVAKHKIVLLTCDESHLPNGVFMPFLGHFQASQIAKEQIATKEQTKAILWQKIIKNKIANQTFVLSRTGHKKQCDELENIARKVRLNDSHFAESRAAALYFKTLFGIDFSRNNPCFINSALNYGYAIVRAAIVRAVCISGLLPWLGVKHANAFNQFNLCDDIIEVFRAFVDMKVLGLKSDDEFLDSAHKRELIEILQSEVMLNGQKMPLIRGVNHFVQSFRNALLEGGELASVSFAK